MYLDAVSGRFNPQNSKSEMHKESTKDVVGCARSFGQRINAKTVTELPVNKK